MATSRATASKAGSNGQQTIEQLQQRYNLLHTQKIQAETKRDSALQQLGQLQQEARDKYGTDDVAQLRAKLEDMKNENEKKRADYQTDLERIEDELSQIEQKFQPAESATIKDAP